MKIYISGGKMEIALQGELDHHAAKETMKKIEGAIEKYMPRECSIDMKELSFMDSSGIALILKTYRLLRAVGGRLCVENPGAQPLRVIDASGIERLVNIVVQERR